MSIELPPDEGTSFTLPESPGPTKKASTEEGPKTREFIDASMVDDFLVRIKGSTGEKGEVALTYYAHQKIKEFKQEAASLSQEEAARRQTALNTMLTNAKLCITQKKQKRPAGWIRVAWSEWRGTLGKLTELQRELAAGPKAKEAFQAQPKEAESAKKASSSEAAFRAKVSHEEMRVLSNVYPNGVPSATVSPEAIQAKVSREEKRVLSNVYPNGIPSAPNKETGAQKTVIDPSDLSPLERIEMEQKSIKNMIKTVQGITSKISGVLHPDLEQEDALAQAKELSEQIEELQEQAIKNLYSNEKKLTATWASVMRDAFTRLVELKETLAKNQNQVENRPLKQEMTKTVANVAFQVDGLSSLEREDALTKAKELSKRIEKLQEQIIKSRYSGEKKLDETWEPAMRDAFSKLVKIKGELSEKQKQIQERPIPQQNKVKKYENALNQNNYGLCVVKSVGSVKKGLQDDATNLFNSLKTRGSMLDVNRGKLFKLQMDYDHPDRITVVGATVDAKGTCSFSQGEVTITGDKYRFQGIEYTKDDLLKALKKEYGFPADENIRYRLTK